MFRGLTVFLMCVRVFLRLRVRVHCPPARKATVDTFLRAPHPPSGLGVTDFPPTEWEGSSYVQARERHKDSWTVSSFSSGSPQ